MNFPLLSSSKKKQHLVSVPLELQIKELLGGFDFVEISDDMAEILLLHTKDQTMFHVQMPEDGYSLDVNGNPILKPRLWSLLHWNNSVERWKRRQEVSRIEREARFIEEANVKRVSKAILKMFSLNPDAATCIALTIVRNKDKLKAKAFGVEKLVESFDEISK